MRPRGLKKLYYSIREVSERTGVEPHVLRFWEKEFSQLRPKRGRSGNRAYTERNLKVILGIKDLLYVQKYTIQGAVERLKKDPGLWQNQSIDGATSNAERKRKTRSSYDQDNRIEYCLRWDMSKYPYKTVKTTVEGVDNSFDSSVPVASKHLERLLGWTAKISAPARTAARIYDWIDHGNDEYVVSLSQVEKVLLHHPAYVALEPKDKFPPKGFIPLKTLIESACGYLLTWCLHADLKEPITDTLGERICRLISSPYQLETDKLWGLLELVGMVEKLGDKNISASYMRTFFFFLNIGDCKLKWCFPGMDFKCVLNVKIQNLSLLIASMTVIGYLSLMTKKGLC